MDADQWVHLLHEIATTIGAVAAAIAAASSLKNGKILRNGHDATSITRGRSSKSGTKTKKDGKCSDWYKPPSFD